MKKIIIIAISIGLSILLIVSAAACSGKHNADRDNPDARAGDSSGKAAADSQKENKAKGANGAGDAEDRTASAKSDGDGKGANGGDDNGVRDGVGAGDGDGSGGDGDRSGSGDGDDSGERDGVGAGDGDRSGADGSDGNAADSGSRSENSDAGNSGDKSSATQAAPPVKDPEVGVYPMPDADEPVTFKMFIFEAGRAPADDNPAMKKLAELTGVSIEFTFISGEPDHKLVLMFAVGDYPDIINVGKPLSRLIEAKFLIPLEDKLLKYNNLWKLIDEGGLLPYMTADDGHVYAIPIRQYLHNGATSCPPALEADFGFFIQKAALAEYGCPIPRTIDEYFDLIEGYAQKYREIDGTKTRGFEIFSDDARNLSLLSPAGALMGAGYQEEVYVDDDTLNVSSYHIGDIAKEYCRRLNEAYLKGAIAGDTFTRSYGDYIGGIAAGVVLGFFDSASNIRPGLDELAAKGKYDRSYIAVPLAAPGYRDGYADEPGGLPNAFDGIALTKYCKSADRVLAYYNWLLQREVQDWAAWGVEGEDWAYTADGKGRKLTPGRRAINGNRFEREDKTAWTAYCYSPKWIGIYASDGMPCGPGDSANEYYDSLSSYDKDFLGHYNVKYPAGILSPPVRRPAYYPANTLEFDEDSPVHGVRDKLGEICGRHYPKIIMSSDGDDFERNWQSFLDEYATVDTEAYFAEIELAIAIKNAR